MVIFVYLCFMYNNPSYVDKYYVNAKSRDQALEVAMKLHPDYTVYSCVQKTH